MSRISLSPSLEGETGLAGLRSQFALDPDYVHLALSMITAHPRPVREAIERHRRGLDANPALYFRNKDELNARVLAAAAHYLETDPGAIALTESTTMGLAVVYTGMKLAAGDEIVTTVHDHYAQLETLRRKAATSGATLRRIPLYQDARAATEAEILAAIAEALTPRTRVLALTWVHSSTGVKLPIARIAELVESRNHGRAEEERIVLGIDGVHALGVESFTVESLGCDFFIAGCHKWLFGPRGTGIVWASARGWSRLAPIMTSFDGEAFWPWYQGRNPDAECPPARLCNPGGFPAFEQRWALAEAFMLHSRTGKDTITSHIHELNRYGKERLARMPHIRLHTPPATALSAGMICFDVVGMSAHDVVEALLRDSIVTGQTPYQRSCNRLAPGALNSMQDLDDAIGSLSKLTS